MRLLKGPQEARIIELRRFQAFIEETLDNRAENETLSYKQVRNRASERFGIDLSSKEWKVWFRERINAHIFQEQEDGSQPEPEPEPEPVPTSESDPESDLELESPTQAGRSLSNDTTHLHSESDSDMDSPQAGSGSLDTTVLHRSRSPTPKPALRTARKTSPSPPKKVSFRDEGPSSKDNPKTSPRLELRQRLAARRLARQESRKELAKQEGTNIAPPHQPQNFQPRSTLPGRASPPNDDETKRQQARKAAAERIAAAREARRRQKQQQEPEPGPGPEPEPEPEPESDPELESQASSQPTSESEPETEPESSAALELGSQPEPDLKSKSEPKSVSEQRTQARAQKARPKPTTTGTKRNQVAQPPSIAPQQFENPHRQRPIQPKRATPMQRKSGRRNDDIRDSDRNSQNDFSNFVLPWSKAPPPRSQPNAVDFRGVTRPPNHRQPSAPSTTSHRALSVEDLASSAPSSVQAPPSQMSASSANIKRLQEIQSRLGPSLAPTPLFTAQQVRDAAFADGATVMKVSPTP